MESTMFRTQVGTLLCALLLAGCAAATPDPPPPKEFPDYEIQLHSPDSWAQYYTRIGLGTVMRLTQYPQYEEEIQDHCDFLTSVTKRTWKPLGMSKERGYRLCYETGPFTEREAKVMCNRLVMRVAVNNRERVVCEADPQNPPPPQEWLDHEYEKLSR
ncbi:MAG TPA: hypothetical protein VF678_08220, partial [bacterium]